MIKKIKITFHNEAFLKNIEKISGESITSCDQCGVCSGSCPFVEEMDITPSQMMRKVLMGDEYVMDNKTMWICATCNACTVRCPRGLDVSKVAEALRQIRLRKSIDKIDINKISKKDLTELPQIAYVAGFRRLTS